MQDEDGLHRPSTALGDRIDRRISAAQMRERLGVTAADLEDLREWAPLILEEEDARIAPWPREQNAGGYSTLQMQARCPFQAFATVRLHARELDCLDWGLDPAERGRLLHRTLEGIWGELRDRDALLQAKAAGRLCAIVEAHVERALAEYRRDEASPGSGAGEDERQQWSGAYLQAEGKRVATLVEGWLAYEEGRSPFLVAEREQKLSADVGGLKLKLRADRIDEIEGGRLLIDYKTGKISSHAWEDPRPDEPQLPLYAAYGDVPALRGVLLAQIRSDDLKFEGCVEEPGPALLPENSRLSPYSEELRREWERILLALGEQFLNGEAQVDPKLYPNTCAHCALPALCRVAEMKLEGRVNAPGALDDDGEGPPDGS